MTGPSLLMSKRHLQRLEMHLQIEKLSLSIMIDIMH